MKLVICNKAKKCKLENCVHKYSHRYGLNCDGAICWKYGKMKCISVKKERKTIKTNYKIRKNHEVISFGCRNGSCFIEIKMTMNTKNKRHKQLLRFIKQECLNKIVIYKLK